MYIAVSFQLNHYLKDVSIAADILTTCNFICLIKCASWLQCVVIIELFNKLHTVLMTIWWPSKYTEKTKYSTHFEKWLTEMFWAAKYIRSFLTFNLHLVKTILWIRFLLVHYSRFNWRQSHFFRCTLPLFLIKSVSLYKPHVAFVVIHRNLKYCSRSADFSKKVLVIFNIHVIEKSQVLLLTHEQMTRKHK